VTRPGSRRAFWWVLAAFATPLLLSFVLYYGSGWRPAGHTNHGELIMPPRPLPAVALPMPGGRNAGDAGVLHGKWSLIYVGDGACDADCRLALYFLQQTHLSLGNLMPRVQRVFLASSKCCGSVPGADLITLDASGPDATDLRSAFPAGDTTTVYVVDPRGNLMMRYDARADPKGLREDLKKLLNLSHIG
jgi:hypothetical protein